MLGTSKIGEVTQIRDGDLSINAREMTQGDCPVLAGILLTETCIK